MSLALLSATRGLRGAVERDPMEGIAWLPNQVRFFECQERYKLIRQGNQWGGKTTAMLAEVIRDVLEAPGREWWIVCASWSQSVVIQQKLHALLPAWALHPATVFDLVKGFRGKVPVVRTANGGVIRIKTSMQGGLQLASATIRGVAFDEPPTRMRLYSEAKKRLLRTRGRLLMALTPVNAGPMDWLREECDQGRLADVHAPLTPDALIPVGLHEPIRLEDGTPCDEDWIAQVRADTMPHEAPVIVDGEWEMRAVDRVFMAWRPDTMITDQGPPAGAALHLGVDYGSKTGKQTFVLVAVDSRDGHDRLWVVDMHPSTEEEETADTTLAQDAGLLVEMLRRNGLRWGDLDEAWGDRAYHRGPADRKSNADLMAELTRVLKVRELRPKLWTVKRGEGHGRGSVDAGLRYLHQAMVGRRFQVHPRCARLIRSMDRYRDVYVDGPHKDPIDALRYALDKRIFAPRRAIIAPQLRIG